MDLHGIGPSSAARLLADTGDIRRFRDRDRFASRNGTAPLDASSGDQQRHRLSRAGNRKINRVLHIMAIVQLRNRTRAGSTTTAAERAGKPRWKRSERSNADSRTWSTPRCSPISDGVIWQAREGNRERLLTPARPVPTRTPILRTSHIPDPPHRLTPHPQRRLDIEGARTGRAVSRKRLCCQVIGVHPDREAIWVRNAICWAVRPFYVQIFDAIAVEFRTGIASPSKSSSSN
ncbi:transposase [Nocardia sp. NPDC006630]|uniref:transposase n=1 Tax=Nocardia sp. NPDC006630 TaxID=3157181 RepID=UPI0033BB503C